ncbi:MAG TPA: cation:proton antiporter [Kofleriaceae bacterium]|jgi:CPA2 family monovalent cation:H+ antiporter-2|nr:cation:proton antiporter [Kofleriaceae bacterium]
MPHDIDIILTFTGGLAAALLFGYATDRLRLSPIVGYLLAGVAIGPFTPGFVASSSIASQFSEVGVILLMFGVGIHFDLKDLAAVRKVAIPGAVIQSCVATGLGIAVTRMFGWSLESGLVFGVAISVASTVVLLRVLADNDELHTAAGHVAVGWLLVEDILTVIALVILPLVVGPAAGSADGGIAWPLIRAVLKIAGLCAFTLVVGTWLLPRLLAHIAKSGSRELFTLAVLTIALGIAVGSALLFGASMALGAFLAGMVVGQSDFSARAAAEALPLRDAFAVLFFVAVGMLFDPSQLLEHLPLTLATLAVVMVGKPLAALAVVVALRQPPRTALAAAIALAQVGEFSFMVASLGTRLGVLPPEATQAVVAVSILSITLDPLLFKLVDPLSRRWAKPVAAESDDPERRGSDEQIVVVGYGPVGRQIVELLRDHHLEVTVIDLSLDAVRELRARGVRAIYGDAAQREILRTAGIERARGLVFSSNAPPFETVKAAVELNQNIAVLTRTTYLREAPELRAVGASVVVAEAEVALAMTENLMARLGATAEQLDRARARVRSEIDREGAAPQASDESRS